MTYRIVYRSAFIRHGRWVPKIAYTVNEKPAIIEGAPDCAYNTRDEALQTGVPLLEADLMDVLTEAEGVCISVDKPE